MKATNKVVKVNFADRDEHDRILLDCNSITDDVKSVWLTDGDIAVKAKIKTYIDRIYAYMDWETVKFNLRNEQLRG